jgi:hypothetical protein
MCSGGPLNGMENESSKENGWKLKRWHRVGGGWIGVGTTEWLPIKMKDEGLKRDSR